MALKSQLQLIQWYLFCYSFIQIQRFLLWILRSSWYEPRKWRNTTGRYCYLLITADTMRSYHSHHNVIQDKRHWTLRKSKSLTALKLNRTLQKTVFVYTLTILRLVIGTNCIKIHLWLSGFFWVFSLKNLVFLESPTCVTGCGVVLYANTSWRQIPDVWRHLWLRQL